MSMIFVFGSNLAGIHGAGAAAFAVANHGAQMGLGIGMQGNSYGLPTKDWRIRSLPLSEIQRHVDDFIGYAMEHPQLQFMVTQVGCGLAGFTPAQIAPMFKDAPKNCYFDKAWEPFLPNAYLWNA
jgi:hypothetical protein